MATTQTARTKPNDRGGRAKKPSNLNEMVRTGEVFRVERDPKTYEVRVDSDITLADYQKLTRPEDWALLLRYAKKLRGKTVVFVNPTMAGGGVAMLRPILVYVLRLLGIDAHWYVMESLHDTSSENPFAFTKMMHNIIQRRMPQDVRITEEGKALHQRWNLQNTTVLRRQHAITSADVIVIDDPQPAPLFPFFRQINPTAKIIWRNHIDNDGSLMGDPSTPQGEIWRYLHDECRIGEADAFVYHPVDAFVPAEIYEKTFFAPATIDPFDDLNRELNDEEVVTGLKFVNEEIARKNTEFIAQGRPEDAQKQLDATYPRLVLVARFDESKGMDKAMALGVKVRERMVALGVPAGELPELVLVGNGSVDDPSGTTMYEAMLKLRRQQHPDHRNDIIAVRLKHNYAAINAIMHTSTIGLQTSEAEGCETRITDWIKHGVPVVISNRGGMALQVIEGRSGYVLDFGRADFDLERGADIITDLLMNPTRYTTARQTTLAASQEFNSREFTTTANAIRWLRIFDHVLGSKPADKTWKVGDLVKEKAMPHSKRR